MVTPGRKFSAGSRYRFGYNGKENDDEAEGEGNQIDYGMRVYDPRIMRFLSVDPLTIQFPYYTPYQYAGNKPINCIDLDGMEELELSGVVNPVNAGTPGSARLQISLDYTVVTQGVGAVTNSNRINVAQIQRKYDAGDQMMRMRTLPTAANEATFLTPKQERWARKAENGRARPIRKLTEANITYFRVNIDYNVTVVNNANVTLQAAQATQTANPARNGVIINLQPRGTNMTDADYTTANNGANDAFAAVKKQGDDAEGYGLRFQTLNINRELNLIILNPTKNSNGYTTNISHEGGHNMTNQAHQGEGGDYEYNQSGLQSNTNPTPTEDNTKRIINDSHNRANMRRR